MSTEMDSMKTGGMVHWIVRHSEGPLQRNKAAGAFILRDKAVKRAPGLHECTFDGLSDKRAGGGFYLLHAGDKAVKRAPCLHVCAFDG